MARLLIVPLFIFLTLCLGKQNSKKPHIVLILADDLGYNDVPWHNPTIIAPHLHTLAREGVVLEQHYAQTKCSPSRAALMTGNTYIIAPSQIFTFC